ncbi:hypothetical protein Fmac_018798 [Flemingia macrophylla]|uniref:Uncharacterized protein n=1 Tax=Flemingia macrophylla TaxID=520843 RepID=A0ABD1M6D1_9FABA
MNGSSAHDPQLAEEKKNGARRQESNDPRYGVASGFRSNALDAALSPLAAASLATEERGDALFKRAELNISLSQRKHIDSAVAVLKTETVEPLQPRRRLPSLENAVVGECHRWRMQARKKAISSSFSRLFTSAPHLSEVFETRVSCTMLYWKRVHDSTCHQNIYWSKVIVTGNIIFILPAPSSINKERQNTIVKSALAYN